MKLLWVTTKPPWPPVDGGRLVAARTIEALAAAGHALEVLAPRIAPAHDAPTGIALTLVPDAPRSLARSVPRAWLLGRAVTLTRHTLPGLAAALAQRLGRAPAVDVVVAEQLQALAQCAPARHAGLPLVLRAQNVESDLWDELARRRPWWRALLRREARLLRAAERAALRECDLTLALSQQDAARLDASGQARVLHVPAPFPPSLPAGSDTLDGAPPVVLFGGAGWLPNASGAAWFLDHVWPTLLRELPAARLHLFGAPIGRGARLAGVSPRPAPADSRAVFAPGAVLAVPVHVASGVRLRILEAWARGVPVMATPEAAAGLESEDGVDLLLARDAAEFVIALRRLADPGARARLVAAGRERLRHAHDPARVAAQLGDVFTSLARARRSGSPGI